MRNAFLALSSLTLFLAGFAIGEPARADVSPKAVCEASVRAALCETTWDQDQVQSNFNGVRCAPNSARFLPQVMALYDETPARMRPSLCTLSKIFVSDNILPTAFANTLQNAQGGFAGAYIGFRKSALINSPSTAQLVSWKDQMAFGGSRDFLSNNTSLVQIDYGLRLTHLAKDGLFYVLMHELAHLIDRQNQINVRDAATTWSDFSWRFSRSTGGVRFFPSQEASYSLQSGFCSYRCTNFLPVAQASSIYTSLSRSGFVTAYAGASRFEDFAEFWTWYLILTQKSANYRIHIPGGSSIDMNAALVANPKYREKLAYIHQLWNSPNLKVSNRPSR